MRDKLIKLRKNIPQVNHAEARVHGMDYVLGCAADYFIANGVTILTEPKCNTINVKLPKEIVVQPYGGKWIPVSERLPEESGEYLVYCGEYDGICVLYYENKWRSKWKEVTHWMPLPEPPKGES